jgi:hypothetical protein
MRVTKSIKQEIEDSHAGAVLALRRAAVIGGLVVLAGVCAALAGCEKATGEYISQGEIAFRIHATDLRAGRWSQEEIESYVLAGHCVVNQEIRNRIRLASVRTHKDQNFKDAYAACFPGPDQNRSELRTYGDFGAFEYKHFKSPDCVKSMHFADDLEEKAVARWCEIEMARRLTKVRRRP